MRNGRWMAIVAALAIVGAAVVGWRGSRPASPVAEVRADGVTVVPATGTLSRADAVPAPSPSPALSPPVAPVAPLDPDTVQTLPARFAAEPRDAAWAPGAEASARTAVADVPHLAGLMAARCAATTCRMTGTIADGLPPRQVDDAMQALQGRSMARLVREGPFRDGSMEFRVDRERRRTVTVWLVRR